VAQTKGLLDGLRIKPRLLSKHSHGQDRHAKPKQNEEAGVGGGGGGGGAEGGGGGGPRGSKQKGGGFVSGARGIILG